jgi:hypothetical protein
LSSSTEDEAAQQEQNPLLSDAKQDFQQTVVHARRHTSFLLRTSLSESNNMEHLAWLHQWQGPEPAQESVVQIVEISVELLVLRACRPMAEKKAELPVINPSCSCI